MIFAFGLGRDCSAIVATVVFLEFVRAGQVGLVCLMSIRVRQGHSPGIMASTPHLPRLADLDGIVTQRVELLAGKRQT